jgi:hypothetical protein
VQQFRSALATLFSDFVSEVEAIEKRFRYEGAALVQHLRNDCAVIAKVSFTPPSLPRTVS